MAELICPGCAGPLPDCFCRSGSTAGAFANVDVTKTLNWGDVGALAKLLPSLKAGTRPPIETIRVDSILPYTPESPEGEEPKAPVHAIQIERTLIVSRQLFDAVKDREVKHG